MTHVSQTYPIIIEQDEDGFFVAINTLLSGCYSQGKTIEEALVNVQEATRLCLDAQKDSVVSPLRTHIGLHLITA